VKMLVTRWVHIPPLLSVAVILVCIGTAVIASLVHRRRHAARPAPTPAPPSLQELSHERQQS
jgi:tellurite resistance protein TerC